MKTEFEEVASPATLCRVCMVNAEDHFTNLYDEFPSDQQFSLHEMLQAICAPVFVNSDSCNAPDMPARVCNVCRDAIIAAFSLHQKCIETDRRLGELLTLDNHPNVSEIAKGYENVLNGQSLTMVDINEGEIPNEVVGNVSKTCSQCGKLFARRFTLLRHQQNGVCPGKSNEPNPKDPLLENLRFSKSCRDCGKEFSRQFTYNRHMRKGFCPNKVKRMDVQKETSILERETKTCAQCGKTFARKYTLFRHKRTGSCVGTEPTIFSCRICDKVYNSSKALQGHYKKHKGSNVLPADTVTLASETDFCSEDKNELKERKPGEVIDETSMGCENTVTIKVEELDLNEDNEYQSSDPPELETVKTENDPALQQFSDDSKTCSVCSETVENISKLKNHMRSFHQLYVCELCYELFPTRHILWYHKLKHKEPSVTCTQCGKKLSNKYCLELHMLRHTGKKMHACELCSMRFTTPGAKANHMRIHKKERPFVCDICGKRVVNRASLVKHVREIHESKQKYKILLKTKIYNPAFSEIRRFVCSVCSRKFASKSHLVCHMLTHTKEKPYKCKLCPQAYSQTNDLVRHVSRAHWSGNPYPCDRCDESFRLIQDLREHYRVHVPSGDGLNEMEEVRFNSMAIMEKLFAKVKQQQAEGGRSLDPS